MFQTKLYGKSNHTFYVKFFSENRAHSEIKWTNNVQPYRPQMTVWRMHIACWIPNATNTHSEAVIIAFPLQKWLQERSSMLRYTYIACICVVLLTVHLSIV